MHLLLAAAALALSAGVCRADDRDKLRALPRLRILSTKVKLHLVHHEGSSLRVAPRTMPERS
ncbi:MAG TPA: hypothetical protein VKT77_02890 [Chthonomonadaceae bacterium]|nr:hypothetical protein [Chthonomonadaceae bacterium]